MNEQNKKIDSNTIIIIAAIVVAALIIGGSVLTNKKSDPLTPNQGSGSGLEIGDAPVLGKADAPHTIVEFLDFQCPYCELFYREAEPAIRSAFIDTGKAKMVYKTLAFLGEESTRAARAGECAKRQGKYVSMHDAIYKAEQKESDAKKNPENSGNLTDAFFSETAQSLGLDSASFKACMSDASLKDTLDVYMNDAEAAMGGRVSTPTIFVDGVKIQNPFDIKEYEAIIK